MTRDISDVLIVSFDSGKDGSGLCVARQHGERTSVLKMELGEQADILYHLLTEQMTKAEIKTRWIPVSEKPQKGRYLCTYEHCDGKCIDFGSFDGESWYIKPIAYMPLPEPYKPQKKECEDCKHYGKLSLDCGRCDDNCSMFAPRESEE